MRKKYFVTDQEWSEIVPLAGELTIQRCRHDQAFLGNLVREYLGDAEGASTRCWTAALEDPTYLQSVVKKYLASLDEGGLLDTMHGRRRRSLVSSSVWASIRSTTAGGKPTGWRVVLSTTALSGLYSPSEWSRSASCACCHRGRWCGGRREYGTRVAPGLVKCSVAHRRTRRWKFALTAIAPPLRATRIRRRHRQGSWFARAVKRNVTYRCYWELLLLQWLGLFVVVVVACAALRNPRSFEQRSAALDLGKSKVSGLLCRDPQEIEQKMPDPASRSGLFPGQRRPKSLGFPRPETTRSRRGLNLPLLKAI